MKSSQLLSGWLALCLFWGAVFAQTVSAQCSTMQVKIECSGTGMKEVDTDEGTWQTVTYNYTVALELTSHQTSAAGDTVTYTIESAKGTVHFWGTAGHFGPNFSDTLQLDDERLIDARGISGTLIYSVTEKRIIRVDLPLFVGSLQVTPVRFEYFAENDPHFSRLHVRLPPKWWFNDSYDSCAFPKADFNTDIAAQAMTVYYDGIKYDAAYPADPHWRIVALGGYVHGEFTLSTVPPSAKLNIRHLTSASGECPGGGYSPVDIIINDRRFKACYDPAQNHSGAHSFVNDEWEIGSYLRPGQNYVRLVLCNTACSYYWISDLSVQLVQPCPACLVGPVGALKVLDANPQFLGQTLLPAAALDPPTLNALTSASLERTKAVADGATQLLLCYESCVPGTVTFAQSGPEGAQLTSVIGSAPSLGPQHTTLVNGKHFAFALYRVPEGISFKQANNPNPPPAPTVSLTSTFVADVDPSQTALLQKNITLAPTPILLVHGLWGKRDDWAELASDLHHYSISRDLVVRNVDYSPHSSKSFAENTWIIPRESANLLVKCRSDGCAVTRVDVVAHSMGGLLTRIAANLSNYQSRNNFNRGYIRRVVTVDTPHHGAPSAALLLHYLDAFSFQQDIVHRIYWMDLLGKHPWAGAVRDFDPHSFAASLGGVAGPACKRMGIPVHTLACEATQFGDVDWIWETVGARMWRDDILDATLRNRNPGLIEFGDTYIAQHRVFNNGEELSNETGVINLWRTVFSGQANDGTVAVSSQTGACSKTTRIAGVSHVKAPHNSTVRERILNLLNAPLATNFTEEGLFEVSQEDLNTQKGWYASIRQGGNPPVAAPPFQAAGLDFFFGQPQDGSNVLSGGSVFFAVEVDAPQQWSNIEVALVSEGSVYGTLSFTNPPFSGTLTCPSNRLGAVELIAMGRNTNGDFRVATVGVLAQRPANVSLVAMSTEPSAITLEGLGDSEAIYVSGEFSDSIKRDISPLKTGTRYIVANTNLASVDDAGRVVARGQGETWIDVVSSALSNRVSLTIAYRPPEILAVWPPSLATVSPTNLVLSISGLRFGGASDLEILHNGQPAVGLTFSNMNVVSASSFMTATLFVGKHAQPGRYEIVVTTPGGRSNTLENKGAQFTIDGPMTLQIARGPAETLSLSVMDPLNRSFILETARNLESWSPLITNAVSNGTWGTNGVPITQSGSQFFRTRILER